MCARSAVLCCRIGRAHTCATTCSRCVMHARSGQLCQRDGFVPQATLPHRAAPHHTEHCAHTLGVCLPAPPTVVLSSSGGDVLALARLMRPNAKDTTTSGGCWWWWWWGWLRRTLSIAASVFVCFVHVVVWCLCVCVCGTGTTWYLHLYIPAHLCKYLIKFHAAGRALHAFVRAHNFWFPSNWLSIAARPPSPAKIYIYIYFTS